MLKLNNKLGSWSKLEYWRTGEWQVIEERLRDEAFHQFNPPAALLFAALRAVHPESVRVAILGQDPYPRSICCTGVAFSVPASLPRVEYPPTLINILREVEENGYPVKTGNLVPWCNQGVLLWNAYPSCQTGQPGSHHWDEWTFLTREIVEKLDGQVVFALLGAVARNYGRYISRSPVIETSHPSPLGARFGFSGSKLFNRINAELIALDKEPIDWRL